PLFSRKDTRDCFQWRVRNLPYPADCFQVCIDHAQRQLVVRTSNKKPAQRPPRNNRRAPTTNRRHPNLTASPNRRYYKRFPVPELDVLSLPLSDAALTWAHANATLVISYAKPPAVLQA
ncbi:Protein DPCD, partial [Tetrabaena socialis]